jgi:prepilin-type N-terminal cleavage/methylation domain-containing protein
MTGWHVYIKYRGMPVSGNGGFSLVELMVSMVILLFVALAMMQTAMVSMNNNTRNVLRDEGVRIAGEKLNYLRLIPTDDIVANEDNVTGTLDKQIRNFTVVYSITNTVEELAANQAVKIDVKVEWTWRNQTFDSTLSSIRGLE